MAGESPKPAAAQDTPSVLANAVLAPAPADLPQIQEDPTANPARWMYERLKKYIKEFEAGLDEDHEVGARLVSFGHALTFHVMDMGYHGPDIITFYGKNDSGEDVQLIQHTSQLSVLLVAVNKQSAQPRRIGFVLDQRESAGQASPDTSLPSGAPEVLPPNNLAPGSGLR
jgi:hypothetical protein